MKTQEKINSQRIDYPLQSVQGTQTTQVKRLFTVREAAQYLGRSVWAMRELIYAGKIKVVKDGKLIFLDQEDLDGYIERHKTVYN